MKRWRAHCKTKTTTAMDRRWWPKQRPTAHSRPRKTPGWSARAQSKKNLHMHKSKITMRFQRQSTKEKKQEIPRAGVDTRRLSVIGSFFARVAGAAVAGPACCCCAPAGAVGKKLYPPAAGAAAAVPVAGVPKLNPVLAAGVEVAAVPKPKPAVGDFCCVAAALKLKPPKPPTAGCCCCCGCAAAPKLNPVVTGVVVAAPVPKPNPDVVPGAGIVAAAPKLKPVVAGAAVVAAAPKPKPVVGVVGLAAVAPNENALVAAGCVAPNAVVVAPGAVWPKLKAF